ncbi:hypothetical protein Aduo_012936 [Ancylostoma duodenale]
MVGGLIFIVPLIVAQAEINPEEYRRIAEEDLDQNMDNYEFKLMHGLKNDLYEDNGYQLLHYNIKTSSGFRRIVLARNAVGVGAVVLDQKSKNGETTVELECRATLRTLYGNRTPDNSVRNITFKCSKPSNDSAKFLVVKPVKSDKKHQFPDHSLAAWIAMDEPKEYSERVNGLIHDALIYFRVRFDRYGILLSGILGFIAGEVAFIAILIKLTRRTKSMKSISASST